VRVGARARREFGCTETASAVQSLTRNPVQVR